MTAQNPAQTQNTVSQPSSPITSSQTSEIKPRSSKWIIAVIAFLVLIAAGGTAVYLLNNSRTGKSQNTQTAVEPTTVSSITPALAAKWKTYTNTKYNYSIDYPDDWSFRESPDSKNGAGFNPLNKPGYPDESDSISISAGQKMGGYEDNTFEEYVKIAGTEIQNYNELASLKKVTTVDGIIGYQTTWMVQPLTIMGQPPTGGESESLPITYFELPGDESSLVRVSLNRDEDLNIYEKMLSSVKFINPPSKLQSTPTSIPTPLPTVNEESLLKTVIKEAIVAKSNGDGSSLDITVSKIEGNYAQGGASDEGGGGMWFAAKVNGVWKLVWDGNGVILCTDLTSYPDFPSSMIPGCYDEATQDTVQR